MSGDMKSGSGDVPSLDAESKRVQKPIPPTNSIPLVDDRFPRPLNTLIMQYMGVETLRSYSLSDTKEKKFDGMHSVKCYQQHLTQMLPTFWKDEINDLQDLLKSGKPQPELAPKRESKESKSEEAVYQHLLRQHQEPLYIAIHKFISGEKEHALNTITRCAIHYCRFPQNKGEALLIEAIANTKKREITPEGLKELNVLIILLLERGAAKNQPKSTLFWTPLMVVARYCESPEMVERLFETPDLRVRPYFFYVEDPFQLRTQWAWSPLLHACCYNSIAIVERFLQAQPEDMAPAQNTLSGILTYLEKANNQIFSIEFIIGTKDPSNSLFDPKPKALISLGKKVSPVTTFIRHGMYRLLRAASNINTYKKRKCFEYKGEHAVVVELGFENEISKIETLKDLQILYSHIINSDLLNTPSGHLSSWFGKDTSLQTRFIATWRERAFKILQENAPKVSGAEYAAECHQLLYHDAFSEKYNAKLKPLDLKYIEYRTRLVTIHKSLQGGLSESKAVVATAASASSA